ncbi:hypothetical protein QYM36_007152, partial [Artemia franciscana]
MVCKNEDGPFVWSQPIQALISTSFLWGYITTNIPGGRLAEVVGTKYLLTGSMLLTSVLTVLVPPAAYLGWQYVVFIRVLMGIALGPSFLSMHPMIAKWIPPTEQSTISALVYGGAELDTVSGLLLTGFIIENIGWEVVFYIEGCFGVVWAVFWLLIVHDNPEELPKISEKEKTYIKHKSQKMYMCQIRDSVWNNKWCIYAGFLAGPSPVGIVSGPDEDESFKPLKVLVISISVTGFRNIDLTQDGPRTVNQETQPGKLNSVMRTLDKFRIDIAGLSETRLTGFGTLNSETYHILYSGLETRKEAGVGMALRSRAKKCLVDWEPINERILRARFVTSQAKLTVIVVYAPTNDAVDQTKDDFYRVLSNVVAKAHRHDIVTLCGNFNAKVGSDASYAPAILGRHGLGEINDNGVRLIDFCATHELIVGAS